MEQNDTLFEILSSLKEKDKEIVMDLHKTALALAYKAKISPMGKKPEDWKCEYITSKPKRVLYILRIKEGHFSIRAKLFHLAEYEKVLENCTEHCKTVLLSASKGCKNHGGGCAGPISFTAGGKAHSICRHSFLFDEINEEDVEGIKRLLESEAESSKAECERSKPKDESKRMEEKE